MCLFVVSNRAALNAYNTAAQWIYCGSTATQNQQSQMKFQLFIYSVFISVEISLKHYQL